MASKYEPGLYEKAFYDVELRIYRNLTSNTYQVALRTWLDDEVFQELPPPPPELISSAPEQIQCRAYGALLYEWLFRGRLQQAFERARWSTTSRSSFANLSPEGGMRFCVALAEDLPAEFANVRWEALHAPDGYLPLSMGTAFSRLIRVRSRPSKSLPPTPVYMLQVRSEPVDTGILALPALDPQMWQYTDSVMKRPWGKLLDLQRLGPAVTLDKLRAQVMRGYHIVYLMAHAQSDEKQTRLILTDEAGQAIPVDEEAWVNCLAPVDGPAPTLVFLAAPASPLSAGVAPFSGAVTRLLRTGARFVITLQGPVEAQQLARFNESFFNLLLQTGLVDVAVATARFEMLDPDQANTWGWTYPVLTMRTPASSLAAAA